MNLDDHSATITSLQFNVYSTLEAQRNAKTPTYTENIELYSASAGK